MNNLCSISKISFSVLLCILCSAYLKYYVKTNQSDIKNIIWWTNLIPGKDRVIKCMYDKFPSQCMVTNNRLITNIKQPLGILFYASHIKNYDLPLPKTPNALWAIYHEESPKNYASLLYEPIQRLFNLTATFSYSSDYPLTLQYLKDLKSLTDKTYFIEVREKNKYLEFLSPVLYIQSDCDTFSDRDVLIKELMQYVDIDSYGSCLNNKGFPIELNNINLSDLYNEQLMRFIGKYKFVISFENALCDDYITEKLWRPLIVGSVPVYLGSPTVELWLPNNSSAILVKDFGNMRMLGDYINKVNEDDTLYDSYLSHKLYSKVDSTRLQAALNKRLSEEHEILNFECFVCLNLHSRTGIIKNTDNIYNCEKPVNHWSSYWDSNQYQSMALYDLIKKK
ncbi:hypothetical protein GWI33_010193 [Rhynchophorus ferrugineus]|uniref:Fucosyltransferase n=1 Tax=Rhynchophorus ferrugineus TaxID=354439 RepID=A0A834IXI8_RHYFE|nr:hypothetical protein GWI33_010193 [Rhynchophorus ferrugineus]